MVCLKGITILNMKNRFLLPSFALIVLALIVAALFLTFRSECSMESSENCALGCQTDEDCSGTCCGCIASEQTCIDDESTFCEGSPDYICMCQNGTCADVPIHSL